MGEDIIALYLKKVSKSLQGDLAKGDVAVKRCELCSHFRCSQRYPRVSSKLYDLRKVYSLNLVKVMQHSSKALYTVSLSVKDSAVLRVDFELGDLAKVIQHSCEDKNAVNLLSAVASATSRVNFELGGLTKIMKRNSEMLCNMSAPTYV
jgi:hypothetical protein